MQWATTYARLARLAAMTLSLSACGPNGQTDLIRLSKGMREQAEFAHAHSPNCLDQVAQKVAEDAAARYPASTASGYWLLQRNAYVRAQTWVSFDANHDKAIEFEEFLSMQWAFYLSYRSNSACSINKTDFLRIFLGVPHTPTSGWSVPYEPNNIAQMYDGLDKGKKGFLTQEDIRSRARSAFFGMDQNHDGRLSPEEMGPAYAPRDTGAS